MAVFNFTPDFGAQKAKKPRVTNIKMGDGYEQRVAFGINTSPEVWTLTFTNRDESEATAIDAFLDDKNGVEAFDWTPPGAATASQFKCQDWAKVVNKANLYTVTATFEQVFGV